MPQLIIGDIHGCYDELQALLDKSGIGDNDAVIAIGDILDRGPYPREVFFFFRDIPNAYSIRGNHEEKHIRAYANDIPPRFAQLLTRWYMGENYTSAIEFMKTMPLFLDLPDAIITHGFFEPSVPLAEQPKNVLLGTMSGEAYLKKNYDRSWYELYDGDKPIIVGHRDYSAMQKPFVYNDSVYGIDTRCVYGGTLTGLLLPEFRFISVPSRRDHWSKLKSRHGLEET